MHASTYTLLDAPHLAKFKCYMVTNNRLMKNNMELDNEGSAVNVVQHRATTESIAPR